MGKTNVFLFGVGSLGVTGGALTSAIAATTVIVGCGAGAA